MLSAVIITKNEQKMIEDCLISLAFADEIIVVDTGNTDQTNQLAKKHRARIVKSSGQDYSQYRDTGLKAAKCDWVLYIDADERVTPALRDEILQIISQPAFASAYALPRKNYFLGKPMVYGGWANDYVTRLFVRSHLSHWVNPLHESPVFTGELVKLNNYLVHFSHRDLTSMTNKTLEFTAYEALLRYQAHHPPIVWWRIFRVMATQFYDRFIKLSAYRDGAEGIIDGLFQVFNTFIIYARLWEMQHSKT